MADVSLKDARGPHIDMAEVLGLIAALANKLGVGEAYTVTQVNDLLSNYTTTSALTILLGDYATSSGVTATLADYATSSALTAALAEQSGAVSVLTASASIETSEARRINPVYIAAALTLTIPAPALGWSLPVHVAAGVTATFDFRTGEADETTVRDATGSAFDLTPPNNTVTGPAYLELVCRVASEVEIWA